MGGGDQRSYYLIGIEFQFCKMQRVLKMDGGGSKTKRMYLIALNCTLKDDYDSKSYMYFTTIKKQTKKELSKTLFLMGFGAL